MLKRLVLALTVLFFIFSVSGAFAVVDVKCFDELFQRKIGQPRQETRSFLGIRGPATIKVYNGDGEYWLKRAVAANITINGETIFTSKDFKKKTAMLEAKVDLIEGENKIDVTLFGMPGVRFRVIIFQAKYENTPPLASAGPDQTVYVGDTVQLDGSGSSDADGDPFT